MRQIVFTDLDGTLLDLVTYSYEKSIAGVNRLKEIGVPLIFCSAKTRAEQEVYRHELGNFHPFIVENGGAIFIPRGYFPFSFEYHRSIDELLVIELGTSYEVVRQLLGKVMEEGGFHFRGFGDMSDEEVAEETGLDIESAKLAKQREYDETVVLTSGARQSRITSGEIDKFLQKIEQAGLNWTRGGRFYGVMGDNDKGKAVKILTGLYRRMWREVKTIGLGDSLNDLPMLSTVDIPILVQKRDYTWENIDVSNLRKVHGIGPDGWSRAIKGIFGG